MQITPPLGIYTLAEAAKLLTAKPASLRRWVYGYSYNAKAVESVSKKKSEPLWGSQYKSEDGLGKVIGFKDLLELRVVSEFVRHGVSLIVVRRCLEQAKVLFSSEHPFTLCRFATDGKTIYTDVVKNAEEPELIDLRNRQIVFSSIIKPSLFEGIEYDPSQNFARRWFPNKTKRVVLDPEIGFGKPCLTSLNVPTEAIYSTYIAEGANAAALKVAAAIFEISTSEARAAIDFEKSLLKKAA
jgi:uncharacterized protein (DUF433 family)